MDHDDVPHDYLLAFEEHMQVYDITPDEREFLMFALQRFCRVSATIVSDFRAKSSTGALIAAEFAKQHVRDNGADYSREILEGFDRQERPAFLKNVFVRLMLSCRTIDRLHLGIP